MRIILKNPINRISGGKDCLVTGFYICLCVGEYPVIVMAVIGI